MKQARCLVISFFPYGIPCLTLSDNILQDAYATYVKDYYLGSFGVSVQTYNQQHLKNTVLNGDSSDRLWWFQVCTEVAYFQVAPSNDSVRSSKVDTRHVVSFCSKLISVSLSCFYFLLFHSYSLL